MIALKDSLGNDFVERVRAIFGPDGLLARARNFEYRPEQQAMAAAVAENLEEERHLVVEAGTGVGKSLAYLVPAVLYAIEEKKKAIVSTHTINLQEQLLHKDIPLVKKILPIEFEAALMKGRQNYICPRRMERALQSAGELFNPTEQADLARLADWARTTTDGTLSDLPIAPDPKVWTQVCSEAHICTAKTCGQNPRCFFQQARRRLLAADVVVINHTLLFMLLGSPEEQAEREEGYLFPNDFIIFDEAHTIEQVASRQIGIGISQYGLRSTIQRLYNARSKKGLFTVTRDAAGVTLAASLVEEADRFFDAIDERANFKKGREYRVREADFVADQITVRLSALQARIGEVVRKTEDEFLKAELQELGRRISAAREGISIFLQQSEKEWVYWIERTGKAAQNISLNASPIDVAPVLRRMLFREDCTSVMTSATLAVGRPDLAYFRRRIGADEAEPLQLGSPFDFQKQMKLFVVRKMPDPRDEAYSAALARWIARFVAETDGRAFVLFTSYRSMQLLAEEMEEFFVRQNMNLLVQGKGAPRSQLLEQFKNTPRSVLFGTDSFWMGVDVPGEALSNVIITRLPFAVPDHPLIEAKLELIQARGGDAFTEYSLPEAILKFRQGVGRLIRTKSDTGIVVVLDNRIVTKTYGRAFLKALPECPVKIL
ncbi:MAG TPA: helicase C-terminal domain-containing protein [Chthoniobacterales bacterium]|nr:helicase C-terminal domain-containing protein [Chthoniobacterales bacterium]